MKRLFSVLLLAMLAASTASASYISLNTALSSKVENNTLKVMVSSVNKGDESAFNVQAEIRVGDKTILEEKQSELPIGGKYSAAAQYKIALRKPGTYPLTLIMHYTDANQYPFSALTCQTFVYQKDAVSPVFGQMRSITFSKDGTLNLTLKNLGDSGIKAKTYLVAPRELTVGEAGGELTIPAKSEQRTSFSVANFSALAGSTYQVFAVSESEDDGLHYTSIAPGTVRIVEANIFANYQFYFIALIAVLLALFISFQFRKK
jgi:hypothetical protein